MPLFSKKPKFNVNVISVEEKMIFTGISKLSSDDDIVNDGFEIQKKFQNICGEIKNIRKPVGRGIITYHKNEDGKYKYFVGERTVDENSDEDKFEINTAPIGLYGRISVYYKNAISWPIHIAKARRFFREKWLPNSGYISSKIFVDMEYYTRREKVDLYFPIIKQK